MPHLDVVSIMVVVASSPQSIVKPNQITPDDVHLKSLVDENQSIDYLSAMMKEASPLLLHQSTSEYYTIYSQAVLIPTKIEKKEQLS